MNIFSYEFFIFWAVGLVLYYTVAKKWQWQVLTLASVVFYALSINKIPVVLLVVWPVSYLGCAFIAKNRNKRGKAVFILTLIICIAALITGRTTHLFALLGNSYFVLKAIGCVIDVYREADYEKNIFKYLNYLIFWPTVFEGPFNRLDDFTKSLSGVIYFDYGRFMRGLRRFFWGVFKKLVIAERLAVFTGLVLSDPANKGGRFVIVAVVAYAIQLYMDFSGFMDMMLGASLTFGIVIPENFRQPYFSKSISEFWRRWHITLGFWFRDYVMFPFTTSEGIKSISKKLKKKNKNLGKLFPVLTGTVIVWALTGLWHGFGINYLLWGLYYAVLMCISLTFNTVKNRKNPEAAGFMGVLQILRTVFLVLIADTLICVNGLTGVHDFGYEVLHNFGGGYRQFIIDGGFGLNDCVIVFLGIILGFAVSVLCEKGYSIEAGIEKMPLIVRWGFYYLMLFVIIVYGMYGSQYDVSQFMYMQF